jgi:hypothetical protein
VLWKLVDVVAILLAIGLVLMLGPDVVSLKRWKNRLLSNEKKDAEAPES